MVVLSVGCLSEVVLMYVLEIETENACCTIPHVIIHGHVYLRLKKLDKEALEMDSIEFFLLCMLRVHKLTVP